MVVQTTTMTVRPEQTFIKCRPVFRGKYEVLKAIGKGKFAVVYRAKHEEEVVALKSIAIGAMDDKSREKCLKEVRLLEKLEHPNIIKYLNSFVDGDQLIIAFEWAAAGDLKRQIRKAVERQELFEESLIWKYFLEICEALCHMHSKRVLHRDLKPANIFLTLKGTVKVGDLGLGRLLSEQTLEAHSKVGTPYYMAPEVLKGAGYDWKSDVWSLGCTFYEMAMLRSPFKPKIAKPKVDEERKEPPLNLYALFQKINKGDYELLPDCFSENLRRLSYRMLSVAASSRPLVSEARDVAREQRRPRPETDDERFVPAFEVLDLSESIVEKLTVLGFREDRLERGLEPLPRLRFAYDLEVFPSRRSQRQFFDFADATQFLLRRLGAFFEEPLDAASLAAALSEAGFDKKLKAQDLIKGNGPFVCEALDYLASQALLRTWTKEQPDYGSQRLVVEDYPEEVNDEDVLLDGVFSERSRTPREEEEVTKQVDKKKEWALEVERVSARLRRPAPPLRDWRDRFQNLRDNSDLFRQRQSDVERTHEILGTTLRGSCDKIQRGEARMAESFADASKRYAAAKEKANRRVAKRDQLRQSVSMKQAQLDSLSNQVQDLELILQQRTAAITDTKHLRKLRDNLATLKADTTHLDVSIGLASNRLWAHHRKQNNVRSSRSRDDSKQIKRDHYDLPPIIRR